MIRNAPWALIAVYASNVFLAFHYFAVAYINSSLLGKYIDERFIGTLYIAGSILNLCILLNFAKLIRRFGNRSIMVCALLLDFAALLTLAFGKGPVFIIGTFILYEAVIILPALILDILLEKMTLNESRTGRVRSLYLTLANSVILITPTIVSFILGTGTDFWKMYALAAVFIIPTFLFARQFPDLREEVRHTGVRSTIREIVSEKNVRNIFFAQFLLHFFYAFMVIYMPLYLHTHIGFDWGTIGLILTFMLLPFVLFEIPLGRLADTRYGEKEILTAGFLIAGFATFFLAFISSQNPLVWALALFLTRVGASSIEIMCESYFFKHVKAGNANIISFFRTTTPLSYIFAPAVASAALFFMEYRFLFAVLGAVTLSGIFWSARIKDTR